jgi:hypothetical protein
MSAVVRRPVNEARCSSGRVRPAADSQAARFAYPAMVCLWFLRDKTQPRQSDILGALCVLSAAPFSIFVGIFVSSFGDNMCYSSLIHRLGDLPDHYGLTDALALQQRIASDVRSLPLRGYETSGSMSVPQSNASCRMREPLRNSARSLIHDVMPDASTFFTPVQLASVLESGRASALCIRST